MGQRLNSNRADDSEFEWRKSPQRNMFEAQPCSLALVIEGQKQSLRRAKWPIRTVGSVALKHVLSD